MSTEKPRRLGRGLDALIAAPPGTAPSSSELQRVAVAKVRPNPFQPRREFDVAELQELADSIRASGLLQPIVVRKTGEFFELIAGERRLRAVSNLGWREIPAIVRDYEDRTLLVMALVENLQRADLNPIEEARGYQRLLGEFALTHQQVAEAVGKDRSTISNLLRVLGLPQAVQRSVEAGELSAGHARALLALEDEGAIVALAREVVAAELSVRDTERRVREARQPQAGTRAPGTGVARGRSKPRGTPDRGPAVSRVEEELRSYLLTDVHLELAATDRGSLRISFYSADDLERLLDLMIRDRKVRSLEREFDDR